MALDEAIERVQKAYEKERLHATPTEVVAQNLGYKGANNGSALSALASLRYYGLVERPKEGFLAVTRDFEQFRFAPDDRQRLSLLTGFLRKPQLYAELLEKYASGLPSDPNLRYELIQRGFNPPAADVALAAFRRSVEFVGHYASDAGPVAASTSVMEVRPSTNVSLSDESPMGPAPVVAANSDIATPRPAVEQDSDQIPVRLPGGRRAWLIIPSPFFASDKNRLKAQIDLLLTQDEEDL
jgi:hypothetical protein